MAGPGLLVTSAPELLWSLWTCCPYGHEVDLALQVSGASWTPKTLPTVCILPVVWPFLLGGTWKLRPAKLRK